MFAALSYSYICCLHLRSTERSVQGCERHTGFTSWGLQNAPLLPVSKVRLTVVTGVGWRRSWGRWGSLGRAWGCGQRPRAVVERLSVGKVLASAGFSQMSCCVLCKSRLRACIHGPRVGSLGACCNKGPFGVYLQLPKPPFV